MSLTHLRSAFVPRHSPIRISDVDALADFVRNGRVLVLTGAGASTESGLPDYRSEDVGLYATSSRRPLLHQTFMREVEARRSFWARNFVAWPRWANARPNETHLILGHWERRGLVQQLVTQNVDQLHYKAGSTKVVELHGTNATVKCMGCETKLTRMAFQKILEESNPNMNVAMVDNAVRPDGDMEIAKEQVDKFVIPHCPKCDGILKPHVVFFGDAVPHARTKQVEVHVRQCDALLVIGSSLHVSSGYRIVKLAKDLGKRVAILNIGPTKADTLAHLRIHAKSGDLLTTVDSFV